MRIVLLLDEGNTYRDIEERLGAAPSTISRWKHRYEKDGVLGLATIHPGQPPQKLTPQLRAKVLDRTRQAPPGWIYALVVAQDGSGDEGRQESNRAHLERSRFEAASVGTLY